MCVLRRSNVMFPMLTEAPRRMTELLVPGVRAQDRSERAR